MEKAWLFFCVFLYVLNQSNAQLLKRDDNQENESDFLDNSEMNDSRQNLRSSNSYELDKVLEKPRNERENEKVIIDSLGKERRLKTQRITNSKSSNSDSKEFLDSLNPPQKVEPSGIPMNCITDYVTYCQSKMMGFKFNDGCHDCKCTNSNSNFCQSGQCKYLAKNFNEAASYCEGITSQNELAFKLFQETHPQKKKIEKQIQPIKPTNKILDLDQEIKTKTKKENIKKITNLSPNLSPNPFPRNQEDPLKVLSNDLKSNKAILPNVMNKHINKVKSDKTEDTDEFSNARKKVGKSLENLHKFEDRIQNKVMKKIDKALNTENINKIDEAFSDNKEEVKQRKSNLNNQKSNEVVNKKQKVVVTKVENLNKFSNIKDKIDKTLKKITSKHLLRNCIYRIAYNELTIKRIESKMKHQRHPVKIIRLFYSRLKHLKLVNLKIKKQIIIIVKHQKKLDRLKGLKRNIAHNGKLQINKHTEIHPKFKKSLNKALNQLNKINHELHQMKAGPKMWFKMYGHIQEKSKPRRRIFRRRYRKSSGLTKLSYLLVVLSVMVKCLL